jgi:murein DD-endopeptidase MepM/ murein hydrolase activator NlpD
MYKKFLAALLIAACAVSVSAPADRFDVCAAKSVSDLKKDLQNRESQRKQTEQEKKEKEQELDETLKKKNELEHQISDLQDDISDIDGVISEKNSEIKDKQSQIDEYSKLIKENDDQLKQRLKAMYESGTASYLQIILESKGLSDLFTRISIVGDIMEHDKNLINTYVTAKETVEAAKKTVETEKAESEEAKSLLKSKKSDLQSKKAEQNELVADLKGDIEKLKKIEKESERQEQIVKDEIARALAAQEAAAKKKQKSSSGGTASGAIGTPAKAGSGEFVWPSASSTRVTSNYGTRIHPITKTQKFHKGLDIGAAQGTDVLAAADGTVLIAGWNSGGYGYYVTINHGGGLVTLYAHNSKLLVSSGQQVKKGQVIAKVGSTGNSTGPHIHFEVLKNGSVVNPYNYL